MVTKIRRFGAKVYHYSHTRFGRINARVESNDLRNAGYAARVVKRKAKSGPKKGRTVYDIYTRPRR